MERETETGWRIEEILFAAFFAISLLLNLWIDEPFSPLVRLQQILEYDSLASNILCFGILLSALIMVAPPTSQLLERYGSRMGNIARDVLPFFLMPVLYESIHSLGPKLQGRTYDVLLMNVDHFLFRTTVFTDLPLWCGESDAVGFLASCFAVCYGLVFAVYGGLALFFYVACSRAVFRKYMLSIILTSMIAYAGYLILPTIGPYEALVRTGFIPFDAGSSYLQESWISVFADRIRMFHLDQMPASDAFPSLHTGWAIVVLGFAYTHIRLLFWILLPWALGTLLGALFFQQHYLTDLIFGLPVATIGCFAASCLVDKQVPGFRSIAADVERLNGASTS